jgi:hypothetical protein
MSENLLSLALQTRYFFIKKSGQKIQKGFDIVGGENIMEKHSGHRRACWKFPKTGQPVEVGDGREREKFFYNEYTSNDIDSDNASTRCII